MRKLILTILIVAILAGLASYSVLAQSGHFMLVARREAAPAGATDYTQDAGAIAYYRMVSSGNTNEIDVVGTNDLTVSTGDTIPSATNRPSGYAGTSRLFTSAETDYLYKVDGGETDLNGTNQTISVGAWVNFVNQSAFAERTLVSKYGAVGNYSWFLQSYSTTAGVPKFRARLSGDGTNYTTTTLIDNSYTTGTWYHVAFTYDDTNIVMYVDGSAKSTNAYSVGLFNSSANFSVGTLNGNGAPFAGYIDEVFLANRAFTTAEIAEIYSDGFDGSKGGND